LECANKFLQKDLLLIFPDIPGSEKSQSLHKENVQIEDYVAVINVILVQEKILTCLMIGHNMDGYIALAFAEKYPDVLIDLGLIHSTAYVDDALKIETRKKGIDFIKQNGSKAFLKATIPNLFYDIQKSKIDIDTLVAKADNFSTATLILYYEAMIRRPNRTEILSTFSKPVLFIIGEYDKAVPFKDNLAQTFLPQQAYILIMRKSTHVGMLEETEKQITP
jgi:pimeloyl-ACP methyl ester carboxylesterase